MKILEKLKYKRSLLSIVISIPLFLQDVLVKLLILKY